MADPLDGTPPPYRKQRLQVDAVTWTAIMPQMNCNTIIIRNVDTAISVKIRTDPADPAQEDQIDPTLQEVLSATYMLQWARFSVRRAVAYLQAVSGTPTVVITYLA